MSIWIRVSFLVQLTLHERMHFPQFSLLRGDPRHMNIDQSDDTPLPLDLRNFRKQLRGLLTKWSKIKGYGLIAELVQNRRMTGLVDVLIRVEHADTRWRNGQAEKAAPRNEIIRVRSENFGNPSPDQTSGTRKAS